MVRWHRNGGAVPYSTAPWVLRADAYTAYQGRLGCHSRASFWASAICAGVMRFAMLSLFLAAILIALRG